MDMQEINPADSDTLIFDQGTCWTTLHHWLLSDAGGTLTTMVVACPLGASIPVGSISREKIFSSLIVVLVRLYQSDAS